MKAYIFDTTFSLLRRMVVAHEPFACEKAWRGKGSCVRPRSQLQIKPGFRSITIDKLPNPYEWILNESAKIWNHRAWMLTPWAWMLNHCLSIQNRQVWLHSPCAFSRNTCVRLRNRCAWIHMQYVWMRIHCGCLHNRCAYSRIRCAWLHIARACL